MTEEERFYRIMRVAELAETGMSVRDIAKFLSENEFKISIATVVDYISRLKSMDLNRYNKIKMIQEQNKPKTARNSLEVQERLKKAVYLLLSGCTIDEIAMILNEKPLTIYRDIRQRLNYLTLEEKRQLGFGFEELELIDNILTEHRMNNLRK